MLHSWKFWAVFLGIAAVVGLLAYGFTVDPKLVKSPLLGKPAPGFTVKRLGGGEPLILSSLKGQPVLLNFWASWCVACREEARILQAAHTRYEKAEGKLKVIGIAIQDTEEKATAFARKFGKTYFLGLDNEAGDISLSYGLYGVPETFFIDAQGVIRYKHVGAVSAELVDREVKNLSTEAKEARP
jgi:cytochrome c biogenesis protein CcmG/thiol:disulfide interchange protein DsbE